MVTIYKITNKINNKSYIGQAKDVKKRWWFHVYKAQKENTNRPLYNALRKHNLNNFCFEELENCDNREIANEREQYFIKELNTISPNGYNLASGGSQFDHCEETKKKMSNIQKEKCWIKGLTKETDERVAKMAKTKSLQKGTFTGKKHTNESIQKMVESHLGQKAWNKGTKTPEYVKKKQSESHKGHSSPRKGIKMSDESKRKLSQSQKNRFRLIRENKERNFIS